MIRPFLAYKFGQLTQAKMPDLLAWATTCEILHNATLIHDDIQDRDTHRRGQLTLWTKFGDVQAMNAGDFLMMSATQPVLNSSIASDTKNKLMLLFSKMACRIVDGQSLEQELNNLSIPELIYNKYMDCVALKTAALFSDLAVGVNMISSHSPFESKDVQKLFNKIGILFQLQDDIIDLYGNKQRDSRGCDIKEGKISFLVATHAKNYPEDFPTISEILNKPRNLTSTKDIQEVEDLFNSRQTLQACLKQVKSLKDEILKSEIITSNPKLKKLTLELLDKILKPL